MFASPYAFFLLPVIPLLVYFYFFHRRRPAVRFSSVALPKAAGQSVRQRFVRWPFYLRIAVLVLLMLALTRPQQGMEKIHDVSKGIAIEMVVDRSSSMSAEMEIDGRRMNRLEVVKKVFREFVQGNQKGLAGRPNDLVGMISFARYADTMCPLTLAHGALAGFLEQVQLVTEKAEDGTAIGDAIMLAAARLQTAEETLAQTAKDQNTSYEIKSKIIILLTDGQNNAGQYAPEQAAAQARKWGIKIYTIGVGDDGKRELSRIFGFQIPTGRGVDKQLLQHLADKTNGMFRMASDGKALRDIYEEINALEKSEVESVRYMDYRENFSRYGLAALILLLVELVLKNTIFRRVP